MRFLYNYKSFFPDSLSEKIEFRKKDLKLYPQNSYI